VNSEQEWRDRLFKEIDKIQDGLESTKKELSELKAEMSTLKVKVATISAAIGALFHYLFEGLNK
jgi:peptidoglycan hydrolase CwlO-like protein